MRHIKNKKDSKVCFKNFSSTPFYLWVERLSQNTEVRSMMQTLFCQRFSNTTQTACQNKTGGISNPGALQIQCLSSRVMTFQAVHLQGLISGPIFQVNVTQAQLFPLTSRVKYSTSTCLEALHRNACKKVSFYLLRVKSRYILIAERQHHKSTALS